MLLTNKRQIACAAVVCAVAGMANVSTAQTGACCIAGVCTIDTQVTCRGVYNGAASCTPDPCALVGVCCRGATCNASLLAANCNAPGGSAGAQFVTTAACNSPGNTASPCCYPDYNKENGISVADVFDYLNDWFAGSPFAKFGGDGTATEGQLAVQDIFDFLNAWFAGC